LLVDANVLVDVLENDPTWADWSIARLRAQAQIHRLFINSVIYAELSLTFGTVEGWMRSPDRAANPGDQLRTPAVPWVG
jgi:hypothetical protein